jgi:ketosteroid isomerase-like protein
MDLVAERDLLLKRDAEWATAASEGSDLERVLSYWTDDAIVMPPGLPAVIGKAALREYLKASMNIPGFSITWTSTDVTFSPDRNLAYMFSDNLIHMNAPDGTPMKIDGRAVTIWRKEPDGQWRCAVDIWNSPRATQ